MAGVAKGTEGYKVRTINCVGCGQSVTKRMPARTRYCSRRCYEASPRLRRRTGDNRTCIHCGAAFYAAAGRIASGGALFCSLLCHNANQGRNKTEHTCQQCGGTFRWSPSRSASGACRITYCSLACRDADPARRARLMEMNAMQQDGRTTRAEAALYAILDRLSVAYERQVTFNGKFIPDATVPSVRLLIQADGDYWHDRRGTSTEARILRRVALDHSQDAYARACGWGVVRLWETGLLSAPDACRDALTQRLRLLLPVQRERAPAPAP